MHTLKTGDHVRLKMNGCEMIIEQEEKLIQNKDEIFYKCVWKTGCEQKQGLFKKDALEFVAPFFDNLHFANYE